MGRCHIAIFRHRLVSICIHLCPEESKIPGARSSERANKSTVKPISSLSLSLAESGSAITRILPRSLQIRTRRTLFDLSLSASTEEQEQEIELPRLGSNATLSAHRIRQNKTSSPGLGRIPIPVSQSLINQPTIRRRSINQYSPIYLSIHPPSLLLHTGPSLNLTTPQCRYWLNRSHSVQSLMADASAQHRSNKDKDNNCLGYQAYPCLVIKLTFPHLCFGLGFMCRNQCI